MLFLISLTEPDDLIEELMSSDGKKCKTQIQNK